MVPANTQQDDLNGKEPALERGPCCRPSPLGPAQAGLIQQSPADTLLGSLDHARGLAFFPRALRLFQLHELSVCRIGLKFVAQRPVRLREQPLH